MASAITRDGHDARQSSSGLEHRRPCAGCDRPRDGSRTVAGRTSCRRRSRQRRSPHRSIGVPPSIVPLCAATTPSASRHCTPRHGVERSLAQDLVHPRAPSRHRPHGTEVGKPLPGQAVEQPSVFVPGRVRKRLGIRLNSTCRQCLLIDPTIVIGGRVPSRARNRTVRWLNATDAG